ncbi:8076_t:CDS:2, partial [Acaulospora morrowiae]
MEAHGTYGPITVPPSLNYFCVYNPTFGPTEETQKDQLLYYTARKTVPMDVKMRQIGLAQGLVNFTRVFSPTKPCENVHTQKNRLMFFEPEPNYWIHISIELGHVKKIVKDKDGKPKTITDYLDANLHDSAIKRMLEIGYEMYKIFNGTFEMTVQTAGVKELKNKLEECFANWVLEWDFDKADIAKTIDGIFYLPLSSPAHTQIASFVTQIKAEYSFISDAIILWQNKLVNSDNETITENEVRELWRYLVPLISERDLLEKEFEKRKKSKDGDKYSFKGFTHSFSGSNLFSYFSSTSPKATPKVSPSSSPPNNAYFFGNSSTPPGTPHSAILSPSTPTLSSLPSFLIGPQNLQNAGDIRPFTIYLSKKSTVNTDAKRNMEKIHGNYENDEHYLLVYKQNSLTVVLLIPNSLEGSKNINEIEFYRSVHNYLSSHSEDLIKIVNEDNEHSKKLGTDIDKEYRYLLFNKISLAIKSSLYPFTTPNIPPKGLTITSEMVHSLCDLHEDLEKYPQMTEICTRSSTNFWIVGKRSEYQVLYVVVPKKEANLTEVE